MMFHVVKLMHVLMYISLLILFDEHENFKVVHGYNYEVKVEG